MDVDVTITDLYDKHEKAFNNPNIRIISHRGGTSSSKTITILTHLMLYAFNNKDKVITIMSETTPKLKRTVVRDMQSIVMKDLWNFCNFNKTELILTFPTKTIIQFVSADSESKIIGMRSDITYYDEVDCIPEKVVEQTSIRTRNKIISSFNPRTKWDLIEEWESRNDFKEIISTYLDNPFLEESIIKDLLYKGSRDENFRRVYLLGEYGNVEGLVFKEDVNWHLIDKLPDQRDVELFAIDFGFTNDPNALIQCYMLDNDIYVKECLYEGNLLNSQIAKEIKDYNPYNSTIIADSAEPKTIAELKRTYGLNVRAVKKESILESIQALKSHNVFVTKDSLNLIKELRNYMWHEKKVDKKHRPVPIDNWNHGIDCLRYLSDSYFKPVSKKKGRVKRI